MIAESANPNTAMAKTGDTVLLIDGKATASLVDPLQESNSWAESVKSVLPKNSETIVVIGIGSGFHLKALRKLAPAYPIVALDTCRHSVDFASKLGVADCQLVLISKGEIENGAAAVLANAGIADWILEPYTVLRHRATMARNRELMRVESWILGRSAEALRTHLALRPAMAAILSPAKLRDVTELKLNTVDVFSVRDLTTCCDVKGEPSVERRMLRVLEELVK